MIRIIASALLFFSITPAVASENEIAIPTPNIRSPCVDERHCALDARLTGVLPTCRELTTTDAPIARRVGSDWILVIPNTEEGRYLKVAIALSAGNEPPEVTWQGNSLEGAISQACVGVEREAGD
jgi:hypothetical protein